MNDKMIADVNAALKYHQEQERQAFEQAIDANPLDSTNHLVYADWLQDKADSLRSDGRHEEADQHQTEADFRRSMGEWHANKGLLIGSRHPIVFRSLTNNLPDGVEYADIGLWSGEPQKSEYHVGIGSYIPSDNDAAVVYPTHSKDVDFIGFRSYRGMESAFRKAFQVGRQNNK